jgi:hypothetical protein
VPGAAGSLRTLLGSLRAGFTLGLSTIAISATVAVFIARRYLDWKSFTSPDLEKNPVAWKDFL